MDYSGQFGAGISEMATQGYNVESAPRRMNTRENLEYRKRALEEQLKNVNNAIEALDQNPNVEKVLDLLAKV